MYGGVGGFVSAAVLAAAASAPVAITAADAKPISTGIRSAFGTYLTFMLQSVVDGRGIDHLLLPAQPGGRIPPGCRFGRSRWRASPLGSRCNPFLGQRGYGFMW